MGTIRVLAVVLALVASGCESLEPDETDAVLDTTDFSIERNLADHAIHACTSAEDLDAKLCAARGMSELRDDQGHRVHILDFEASANVEWIAHLEIELHDGRVLYLSQGTLLVR